MNINDKPLVTIAIPTYNRADGFLPQAIECALNQTYPNLEILISDNHSTDHTESTVANYQDKRIRYIKQPHNIGANNNFNFCFSEARGEFVLLLLDDDMIDPDFIEACMDAAKTQDNVGLVRTGTRIIDIEGNILMQRENPAAGMSPTEFFLAWFNNKITLYVCSTLFNTEKLREMGGFNSRHNLFQDGLLISKLIAKYNHANVKEVKAGFRQHDKNMGVIAESDAWCEDSLDLLKNMCDSSEQDKSIIKTAGMIFFCKMNYTEAARLTSPFRRFYAYYRVAKHFDFAYSPFKFALKKDIRPALRKLKRLLLKKTDALATK